MKFTVEEVTNQELGDIFIEYPSVLYKNVPQWVHPLNEEIKKIFDPNHNPCFTNGECIRWMLKDESGRYVGRVAAFINRKTCALEDYTVGQMGFFECIDNQEAAFTLFDTCADWLKTKGMDSMEGPVNFGERIEWWGLLAGGFNESPVYGMPYTHEYYVKFFENYGFKDYFKQFTYRTRLVIENLSPIVIRKSERLLQDTDYKISTYRDLGKEKAIEATLVVYNKAWNMQVHHVDGITRDQVNALYDSLKAIIDPDLLYFAFYKDEPIGFFFMFPELNQVLKHLNGKMNVWGIIKFLYYRRKIDVALGQLFGVVPEFQSKGVEAALIYSFCKRIIVEKGSYKYLELNWVGDFNPPMNHLMRFIGASVARTHITYRKLFRDDIEFKRQLEK